MSVYERCKYFEQPFMYIVQNPKIKEFCSYCLRKPEDGKPLMMCGGCNHMRYCDKNCQRLAWLIHKPECKRLKNSFPNLPLTEVLFLCRGLDRLAFIKEKGDKHNWQRDRPFDELLGHEEEIKEDKAKMAHFDKMFGKLSAFMGKDMVSKEEFFTFHCKVWINSHSIHNSTGTEIGMALDLGVSKYDHSCRPNCTLVFDGFRAMLRPLGPATDASDWQKSYISYTDVGKSRYQRRKTLKSKWYFDCECERCSDPDDDKLTSIRCVNEKCSEPITITEDSKPVRIPCPKCKAITEPERVMEAQNFMLTLPDQFPNAAGNEEMIKTIRGLLDKAGKILHEENIYYCRLLTAATQVDPNIATNPDMHKLVYANYRRCLPKADRHIGYQLLHLVRSLIDQSRRDEAVPYAYEAMTIFEIAFGLDHPYYLQTLALWTFLDKPESNKTDDELLSLMNFNYNRPLDISKYLEPDTNAKAAANANPTIFNST